MDISVDVLWMLSRSHPRLMACGNLSPEASRLKSPTLLVFCPASPSSSVLYLPLSPGAFLLEMGPALDKGGTEWSGWLGVPWSSAQLPMQGCGWARSLGRASRLHLWPDCPMLRPLEQVLRWEVFRGPLHLAPATS